MCVCACVYLNLYRGVSSLDVEVFARLSMSQRHMVVASALKTDKQLISFFNGTIFQ